MSFFEKGDEAGDRIANRVFIFDTTLRDGQQCPGAGISVDQNLEYAKLAAQLRVDILEAGFPSASAAEFEIVQKIAKEFSTDPQYPTVAALCQLRMDQIDKTILALEPAIASKKARLHTYVPVDPKLMRASLGSYAQNKSKIVNDLYTMVRKAYQAGLEVQFSPEGYSRQAENFDFVTDLIRAAVEAGATIINCPDTMGWACRLQKDYFVDHMNQHARIIKVEYPGKEITWSVHCHNDFGLALENTMMGVFHGPARQIEGCFNGIGERAGNVSLEQCIMYMKHFAEQYNPSAPFYTRADSQCIQKVSDFVSRNMLQRQPHWPITGDNAMRHTSGGHTNASLKDPTAYQPFPPEEVGRQIEFVFGPSSGGNHAQDILKRHGYSCGDEEKAEFAQFIKTKFSHRRKGITDDEVVKAYQEFCSLKDLALANSVCGAV